MFMRVLIICLLLSFSFLCADENLDFAKLVRQLGDDDYKKRLEAKEKLKQNIFEALPEILKAENDADLEVASSVGELISSVANYRSPAYRGTPIKDIKDKYGNNEYKNYTIKYLNDFYEHEYSNFDRKNTEWDDEIKALYTEMVIAFRDKSRWNKASAKKAVDSLDKKKCDSIVFFYLAGSFYHMDSMNDKCKAYLEKVLERDGEFKGSKMFFYMASLKLCEYFRSKKDNKNLEQYKKMHLGYLPEYIGSFDFSNILLVRYIDQVTENSIFLKEEKIAYLNAILSKVPEDSLFYLILQGRIHSARAWTARGNGFANEVTKDGASIFQEEIKKSAACYEQAYAKFPNSPIAPKRLIAVSTYSRGASQKTSREWFEKTIEVEYDYTAAYDSYYNLLDARWGGGEQDQLAFIDELILAGSKYETFYRMAWNLTIAIIKKEYDWQCWLKNEESFSRLKYLYKKLISKNPQDVYIQNSWAIFLYGKGDIEQHLVVKEKLGKNFNLKATYIKINENEYWPEIDFYNKFHKSAVYKEYSKIRMKERFVMTPEFRELYTKLIRETGSYFLMAVSKKHLLDTYEGSDLILNDLWKAGYKEALLIMLEHHLRRNGESDPKIIEWYMSKFQRVEIEAHVIFSRSNPYFPSNVVYVISELARYFKEQLGDGFKENLLYKKAILRAYLRFRFYEMDTSQMIKKIDELVTGITDYGDIFDFSVEQYLYAGELFEKAKFLWRLYVKVFSSSLFNFEENDQLLEELDNLKGEELYSFWLKHGHIGFVDDMYEKVRSKNTFLSERILYLNFRYSLYSCEAIQYYHRDFRDLNMALGNTLSKIPRTLLILEKAVSIKRMPEISLLASSVSLRQKKWDNVKKNLQNGLVRSKTKGPFYCERKKFETQEELLDFLKTKIQNHDEAPQELKDFAKTCVLKD